MPYLYHPYVGHDNNRDMYMFTQKESQYTAQLAVARLVPDDLARSASDGQQRRAHLRDAGDRSDQPERAPVDLPLERRSSASRRPRRSRRRARTGSSTTRPTRTSGRARWPGAAGGTTRSACSPKSPARASPRRSNSSGRCPADPRRRRRSAAALASGGRGTGGGRGAQFSDAPLPPPTDINPRTEYPRPWLGGRWTLRDIVDYELIATMALLETAADRRETICGRSTR